MTDFRSIALTAALTFIATICLIASLEEGVRQNYAERWLHRHQQAGLSHHTSGEAMTAPHLDPEIVERAAKACVQVLVEDDDSTTRWEDATEEQRDVLRLFACTALTAALGDHSVIVPRAITPVITKAYIAADPRRRRFAASAKRDWNAMISAAHDKGNEVVQKETPLAKHISGVAEASSPGPTAEDLESWMKASKYLPPILRDFHDQKDCFKAIHEIVAVERHEYAKGVAWTVGQCYVIDIFLWFMARRGYTLQKSRADLPFRDYHDDIRHQNEKRQALSARILAESFASPTPAEGL